MVLMMTSKNYAHCCIMYLFVTLNLENLKDLDSQDEVNASKAENISYILLNPSLN